MLSEYKDIYKKIIQENEKLNKLSKDDLCRYYVSIEDKNSKEAQDCLGAIIYRFWFLATKMYYNQDIKLATEQDCYDTLIDSILFALQDCAWEKPDSSIYKDPLGPEKAISTIFTCSKINYFIHIKRQKRKINYESMSLDELIDNTSDSYFLPYIDKKEYLEYSDIDDIIIEYFNNKDYFSSFLLDAIMNVDICEDVVVDGKSKSVINKKIVKKYMQCLDKGYCVYFSNRYKVDYYKVYNSLHYVNNIDNERVERNVDKFVRELKNNKKILDLIGER